MNKRGKIMVGGVFTIAIGIIVTIHGIYQYRMVSNGVPPGTIETIIGILIAVAGAFISIYGFGLIEGDRKSAITKNSWRI